MVSARGRRQQVEYALQARPASCAESVRAGPSGPLLAAVQVAAGDEGRARRGSDVRARGAVLHATAIAAFRIFLGREGPRDGS